MEVCSAWLHCNLFGGGEEQKVRNVTKLQKFCQHYCHGDFIWIYLLLSETFTKFFTRLTGQKKYLCVKNLFIQIVNLQELYDIAYPIGISQTSQRVHMEAYYDLLARNDQASSLWYKQLTFCSQSHSAAVLIIH